MPELPPRAEVVAALQDAVGPAGGAAAAALGLGLLLAWLASKAVKFDWRRAAPPAAVLALAAALVAGNSARGAFDSDPAKWEKWWHWGWPAVGLALFVELVARLPGVAVGVGHLLRGAAAGVVAWAIVPPAWQAATADKWVVPAVAFGTAIQWAVVDAVGRRAPGGSTSAAVAGAALGATVLLAHHTWSPTGSYVMAAVFAGLAVVAVLAWATRTDGGPAAAAATAPLAVLLVLGRALIDSKISQANFLAVALSPLALCVFLLPGVAKVSAYRAATPLKVLVVLAPVAWAVYRAMEAQPLTFTEGGTEADEWK